MKNKVVFVEVILLLVSVIIFRSVWLLLDKHPLTNDSLVLVISLAIAIAVAAASFYYIYRHSK